jgi:hypothetical protein
MLCFLIYHFNLSVSKVLLVNSLVFLFFIFFCDLILPPFNPRVLKFRDDVLCCGPSSSIVLKSW